MNIADSSKESNYEFRFMHTAIPETGKMNFFRIKLFSTSDFPDTVLFSCFMGISGILLLNWAADL